MKRILLVVLALFSFQSYAFENDDTWESGFYFRSSQYPNNSSYWAPTQTGACSALGRLPDPNNYLRCWVSLDPYVNSAYIQKVACPSNPTGDYLTNAQCGSEPALPEPQNCSEFSDQNPEPFSITISGGYDATACYNGCTVVDAGGVGIFDGAGDYHGSYRATSRDCNGGYQPGLGVQEEIDFYAHDYELQNCYDNTGRLIGQISSDLTCPSASDIAICYDPNTAQPVGKTGGSTACEVGVKYNELTQSQREAMDTNQVTKSTVINPDGTVTQSTETTSTQKGLDGSTSTSVSNSTTVYNQDGSSTTTSSAQSTVGVCTGPDCPPENSLAKYDKDKCSEKLVCTGDFWECEKLKIQREQACALTDDAVDSWVNSEAYKDNVFGEGDVNSKGQLTALDGGSIDVSTQLGVSGWMVDDGVTASCPAIYSEDFIEIDFGPMCQFFEAMRPVVLFFNGIAILWFLRRSLLESD